MYEYLYAFMFSYEYVLVHLHWILVKTASMLPRDSSINTRPASGATAAPSASASLSLPGVAEGKPRSVSGSSTNTTELLGTSYS